MTQTLAEFLNWIDTASDEELANYARQSYTNLADLKQLRRGEHHRRVQPTTHRQETKGKGDTDQATTTRAEVESAERTIGNR